MRTNKRETRRHRSERKRKKGITLGDEERDATAVDVETLSEDHTVAETIATLEDDFGAYQPPGQDYVFFVVAVISFCVHSCLFTSR